MITNKHISKIIVAVTALAVIACFLAVIFSDRLNEAFGGTGVKMEYEYTLFDTDEIISVNIIMDQDDWDKMLANATSEEYYACDVVINGETYRNVGIRPKGNTSLSSIAMNPDSDRFSLKLEFGHFVDGQTCHGLDKLILNNNYADATNMKEAIVYDMFGYLGADSSLYNYAKVSVNGEYYGVYLALEAVEQSFMLRNYGTQDGELYKPDSMEMGGGGGNRPSGGERDENSGFGGFNPGNFNPEEFNSGGFNPGERPDGGSFNPSDSGSGDSAGSGFGGFNPSNFNSDGFNPGERPDGGSFNPSGSEDNDSAGSGFGGFNPGNFNSDGFNPGERPDGGSFGSSGSEDSDSANNGETGNTGNKESGEGRSFSRGGGDGENRGFSRGGGGSDLNYTDDDLDSYSTIWNSSITGTSKADRRRVVTALKNISEGNDLETYLDIDNVLKYMAVHTFSVNLDSLSGNMSHNYYLYEYDGQLNILPWDYNLCLGGMSMGSSGNASDTINDAIDTPFAGTHFFDALLENEEYLAKYHEYLQQLVDEYVNGGRFEEVYNHIRSQIDSLVETDPTAFYKYDEYQAAAEMLYKTILLRAESISGQLDGTIPSTDEGQRKDSSTLVDSSSIDLSVMGEFNMGGNFGSFKVRGDRKKGRNSDSESDSSSASPGSSDSNSDTSGGSTPGSGNMPDMSSFNPGSDNMPDMSGFNPGSGNMPDMSGFNPGSDNTPDMSGFNPGSGNMPDMSGFTPDSDNMPDMSGFNPGSDNMPDMSGFNPGSGNMPDMSGSTPGSDNMPDMSAFNPGSGNMPDMSGFNPGSGNMPDMSGFNPGSDNMPDMSGFNPGSGNMPGRSATSNTLAGGIILGACFAAVLAAIITACLVSRRRWQRGRVI